MAHPIDISEQAGVRSLHFGSDWIQGAMRIRRPFSLELAYTREMMACLLLRQEAYWPQRALLIGLGAGSLTKFIYRHLPETHLTAVEIDARIAPIARQYFRLPIDPARLEIIVTDGADYVERSAGGFDLILVDGFGPTARPGRLDTPEFYAACAGLLSRCGLWVCNLLGHSRGFTVSTGRIAEAFAGRSITFPSCDSGNAIAFGAAGDALEVSLAEMKSRAMALKRSTGLDLRSTIARLKRAGSLPGNRLVL